MATSDVHLAPSSSGQDRGFSALKPGFDSPWRYIMKGRAQTRPSPHLRAMVRTQRYALRGTLTAACFALLGGITAACGDAPTLTLEDAVHEALRLNPALRAARHASAAEKAEAARDKPVGRPVLTAEAEITAQGPRVTLPQGVEDGLVVSNRFERLRVTLDQPLYRAGLGEAGKRYRAMLAGADQRSRIVENDLIRDVRRAYIEASIARAMLHVAEEARSLAADHLALVKRMVEAGLSAPRDVLAAEADLAEADEGLLKAKGGLALALANLARLIGGAPTLTPDMLTEPGPMPSVPPAADAIAQALAMRPELIALRFGIEAAEAGRDLARSQTTPTLSLRASVARQTPTALTSRQWAGVGLRLDWPILDGDRAATDARTAQARLDQLRAQLEEAESGIRLEVLEALSRSDTADARVAVCERRLAAARSALTVSRMRYEQRTATLMELASSRLATAQADAALRQASLDRLLAWADLRHATAADLTERTAPQ